jgi:acyl-CoA reductase-like NAD-dependent aldehyde dehydrogenase
MTQTLTPGITPDKNSQYRTAKNWINGEWVDSSKHTDSFDPATGNRIGVYADASLADAHSAVAAAVRAFQSTDWKDNRKLRAKVLNQIADRRQALAGCGQRVTTQRKEQGACLSRDHESAGTVFECPKF